MPIEGLLLPLRNIRKLTGLPDLKLPYIMTYHRERKDAPVRIVLVSIAQKRRHPTDMVIVSSYQLIENPEKGVFC